MKKFRFRVCTKSDPEDGFNAWTTARTPKEGAEKIRREYHSVVRVDYIGEIK